MSIWSRSLLLLLLVTNSLTLVAFSQQNRGTILGLITDPTSASVAGATVRAINLDTNIVTTAQTDKTGNYEIPFLAPGNYRIEVEAPTFSKVVNQSISLHADQSLKLDFSMTVGSTLETVSVTARAPMLQTSSTSTGQTIESASVQSLPLLSRSLATVAIVGTGMQPSQNVISQALSPFTGGQTITANGIRDSANQYTIDSANVNLGLYNAPAFTPVPESVQEFSVQTGNYSAEYGQYAGAHVNYVLKSGTNDFHGNVFEYLQNTALNARNYFSPTVPVLHQNQFGFFAGGPIIKNKTFFLVSYQGLRNSGSSYVQTVVLTDAQRGGNLTQDTGGYPVAPFKDPNTGLPFAGNIIPASRISRQAAATLTLEPHANLPGATNNGSLVKLPSTSNGELVKIDHALTKNDIVSGRFLRTTSNAYILTGTTGDFAYLTNPITANNAALIETHAFSPTTVLYTQISWIGQNLENLYPQTPSDLDVRAYFDMAVPSNIAPGSRFNTYPVFAIDGYTPIGEYGNLPLYQKDANYQVSSQLSVAKGKHNFQFGYEVDRYRSYRNVNDYTSGRLNYTATNPAGSGNALADFLLGLPSSTSLADLPITVDLRRTAVDLYAQDKWSITPKLTSSLGLRYELNSPSSEHNGMISLFNFTYPGSFQTLSPGSKLYQGDLDNFAPRIGLSYSVTNKDVIRTSGGIYYSNSPQLNLTFAASNPPFIASYSFNSAAGAPLIGSNPFPLGQIASGGVVAPFAIQSNAHTPTVYQWMLDFQHSINPSLLFDVAYIGNRGTHFGQTYQRNIPLTPGPGAIQARRPLPNFGPASYYEFESFSTYQSLQAKLEKRFSHGLQFLASYTWSKSLDLSSNELLGGTVVPSDPKFNYGPSDFDVSQNLTLSYVYDFPVGDGRQFLNSKRFLNEIIGGWQLSGITMLHSGLPVTVSYPGDVANTGLGTRPNRICNGNISNRTIRKWFDTSCFAAPAQYTYGNSKKGIIVGPGFKNWNLSLKKGFSIFREQILQFHADFFNAFNNTNFGQPGASISTSTAGTISSAQASRLGQLGLDYHF